MSILWTIIIGLLAGLVAKLLMPGRDPGGFIITILLGIAGAFVATWLGQAVGFYEQGEAAGFIGAVIGAIIILVIYRFIVKRRASD
ncbi:GlsB/YeaQ/YmgE family stress response membrane protein [Inquilinus sp. CAU 1745]|uniref:GlsB/YeaQ/YmgE family stress response membrane protein n=1 Tax=Inquilinus sp. CAU 1745 TaxID=3140369 RepID=UPI00325C007F